MDRCSQCRNWPLNLGRDNTHSPLAACVLISVHLPIFITWTHYNAICANCFFKWPWIVIIEFKDKAVFLGQGINCTCFQLLVYFDFWIFWYKAGYIGSHIDFILVDIKENTRLFIEPQILQSALCKLERYKIVNFDIIFPYKLVEMK